MSDDMERYWSKLDTMSRKEVLSLAEDEFLDIPGLSKVANVLRKYNLTEVTINHKLQFALKRSLSKNPRSEHKKEKQPL